LILSAATLLVVGLLALWSASSVQPNHGDFRKQVVGIILGVPFFFLFFLVDPRVWGYYSRAVYTLMLALLGLVFVPGVARSAKGAERWIDIGPVALQPSEIAKLLIILVFADYMARQSPSLRTVPGLIKSLLFIIPPFLLVAAQPNLSTSLCFLAIWAGISLVAHQRIRYLVVLALMGIAVFGLAWKMDLIKPYQKERVVEYMSGNLGFHTERSLTSIGSGGLGGRGFLQGELKEARYVPEATTDFIFAVISEEGGFVGSVLVVCLYAFFLWRIWLVAAAANVRLFKFMAAGVFVVFSFHVLVNLYVVAGLIPVTGVPLPFISFGRSAMLLTLAALGLLLNLRGREKQLVF
jgi:rod shape determining protein RodA